MANYRRQKRVSSKNRVLFFSNDIFRLFCQRDNIINPQNEKSKLNGSNFENLRRHLVKDAEETTARSLRSINELNVTWLQGKNLKLSHSYF